jgi:hypothetical protein
MWYLDWHPIRPNACSNRCRLDLRSGGSNGFGLGRCMQGVPRPDRLEGAQPVGGADTIGGQG